MLTSQQQWIRNLWDGGYTIAQIADEINRSRSYVIRELIKIFGYTPEYLATQK